MIRKKLSGPRQKRITAVINSGLLGMMAFLLVVMALSIGGLKRFQASLDDLAQIALPNIMQAAVSATKVSELVLLADRLVYVNSEAERRLIQRNIDTYLTTLAEGATLHSSKTPLPQIEILSAHLKELYVLVDKRLALNELFAKSIAHLDEISYESALVFQTHGESAAVNEEALLAVQKCYVGLLKFLSNSRKIVATEGMRMSYTAERRIATELQLLKKLLNTQTSPLRHDFIQFTNEVEDVFFASTGIIPTMRALARISSESVSAVNVARSMVQDLNTSHKTYFNEFIESSSSMAKNTATELARFSQFFMAISVCAVLIVLGIIVYFRRAFIIRLEKLNATVLDRIDGVNSLIDTEGSDEIAEIARSVNYFATELGISKDKAEASSHAKGEFITNMSHEIRTPMNAVIGFARMLNETELTEKQHDYVEKLNDSAVFLLNMFNDILDFSALEQGSLVVEKTSFELHKVLQQIVEVADKQVGQKNIVFSLQVDPAIPQYVVGIPLRLFQILSKLCDNAIKFTTQGSVILQVAKERQDDSNIYIKFSVIDSGIGFSKDAYEVMSQPFSQGDTSITRARGGVGLGLSISTSLCEFMGGTLQAISKEGEGSTFFFTLPFGHADAVNVAEEDVFFAERFLEGKNILLVEDNSINQEIALALFEKTGALIDVVDGGQKAVEKVQSKKYDLVLMDIQMPDMDGITATQKIRHLGAPYYKQLPIIAMTAHNTKEDKEKSLAAGMNAHLSKPLDPSKIFSVVWEWINKAEQ